MAQPRAVNRVLTSWAGRDVTLLDDDGAEVVAVNRFLSRLLDANYSPNTVCAYGYDLRHLARFLDQRALGRNDFGHSTALEFLAHLRRVPSRQPAQRLGLTVATEQQELATRYDVSRFTSHASRRRWKQLQRLSGSGQSPAAAATGRSGACL